MYRRARIRRRGSTHSIRTPPPIIFLRRPRPSCHIVSSQTKRLLQFVKIVANRMGLAWYFVGRYLSHAVQFCYDYQLLAQQGCMTFRPDFAWLIDEITSLKLGFVWLMCLFEV